MTNCKHDHYLQPEANQIFYFSTHTALSRLLALLHLVVVIKMKLSEYLEGKTFIFQIIPICGKEEQPHASY